MKSREVRFPPPSGKPSNFTQGWLKPVYGFVFRDFSGRTSPQTVWNGASVFVRALHLRWTFTVRSIAALLFLVSSFPEVFFFSVKPLGGQLRGRRSPLPPPPAKEDFLLFAVIALTRSCYVTFFFFLEVEFPDAFGCIIGLFPRPFPPRGGIYLLA